jgi:hypothetical protein
MWLSVCVSGEEDVAGVCALPGRAGDAHSSMHARHAGSSRVRARRSAAGDDRQAHRDLGRHHHAMIMTWAGWTQHVIAARAARASWTREWRRRPLHDFLVSVRAFEYAREVLGLSNQYRTFKLASTFDPPEMADRPIMRVSRR